MIHENSLKAYQEIYATLPEMRRKVFWQIVENGPITLEQIAENLGTLPHKISGRITKLKEDNLIIPAGKSKTSGGRTCDTYKPAEKKGQLTLF